MNINSEETKHQWKLFHTNKCSNGAQKLYSQGFVYTFDKPSWKIINVDELLFSEKFYWKFEDPECGGRGISTGFRPPLTTKSHFHHSNPGRLSQLNSKQEVKNKALNSHDAPRTITSETLKGKSADQITMLNKPEANRQYINRQRKQIYRSRRVKSLA